MFQYPQGSGGEAKLPGQLRVKVWFGLAADAKHFNQFAEGKLSVFAETVRDEMRNRTDSFYDGWKLRKWLHPVIPCFFTFHFNSTRL